MRTASQTPQSTAAFCAAYAARMSPDQFFSHGTAAELHQFPIRARGAQLLHVSVAEPAHPPQARGVKGHRLAEGTAVVTRNGLRLVSAEVAWCQLARELSHNELVVVGDFLVRRKRPLSSLAKLRAVVDALGAVRGVRAMRRALEDVRAGTDSPMETRVRLLLVAGGLPEPVIHFAVRDADGFFVATPDLAYVKERIAIEYEGEFHQTDRRVYAEDIARREALGRAGWLVILVISDHLSRPQFVVRRVATALRERAAL
ncbi:MAG TPA: hypothetical protein DCP11_16150 [Microbacteriaceae bacterium]|nr:hypothetical protein [Microbacteriaceae bacterium]